MCEDVDQFQRLATDHRVANLPRVLIDRRIHDGQTIRRRQAAIRAKAIELAGPMLERMGVRAEADDVARHVQLGDANHRSVPADEDFLRWAEGWLEGLRAANARVGMYDAGGLALASGYFWALACAKAARTIGHGRAVRAFASARVARGLTGPRGRRWLGQAARIRLG